jgi:hypothetical protein
MDRAAAAVIKDPKLVPVLFSGLNADKASVRFRSSKVLLLISKGKPAVLYPHIDSVFGLLESENNIMKWGAIHMIGDLARVDSKKKIDRILGRYLEPIPGPELVAATNVIGGAAKIGAAKPNLTDKIVRAILKAEKGRYRTSECRNIVLGHAIEALDQLFSQSKQKEPIAKLVKRQLKNRRNATRKKAERFVKRWLS